MFATRGYVLDVSRRTPSARTFTEIVDLLARCRYTTFRPYAETGFGALEIDLGRLGAYCTLQGVEMIPTDRAALLELRGSDAAVFADTESARSLAGRVEEMRERMGRAEEAGRLARKTAFYVTDFGDDCSWQPLAASLPGIILGGNFATGGRKAAHMDLERELDATMGAPLGGLLLRLGTLYLRGGAVRDDRSELFEILSHDHGYSRHPGLTSAVLEDIGGVARGVRIAAERWADRNDWAREIVHMANLLDAACHRRDERRLRELRDEHGRLWRLRCVESNRIESLARLPRF